ncbi:MAG: DUF2236 domain-containing protein, partial [Cyanobacteria bacterium P01_H01_bin.130]
MATGSQTQYFKLEEARDQLGDRADYYWHSLHQMDPLADDAVAALAALPADQSAKILATALNEGIEAVPQAPDALKALFEQMAYVPWWVDWDRIERGGKVFRQAA